MHFEEAKFICWRDCSLVILFFIWSAYWLCKYVKSDLAPNYSRHRGKSYGKMERPSAKPQTRNYFQNGLRWTWRYKRELCQCALPDKRPNGKGKTLHSQLVLVSILVRLEEMMSDNINCRMWYSFVRISYACQKPTLIKQGMLQMWFHVAFNI